MAGSRLIIRNHSVANICNFSVAQNILNFFSKPMIINVVLKCNPKLKKLWPNTVSEKLKDFLPAFSGNSEFLLPLAIS